MSGFNGKAQGTRGLEKAGHGARRRGAAVRRPVGGYPAPAVAAPNADSALPRLGWREAISTTVSGLGFELVDVERAQRGLLRVTIDRIPGRRYAIAGASVVVEDCEQVTRQLQYALEVESLEYARLEVSSPGLDRPLKSEGDYRRFAGQAINLTLKLPFEGRKAWKGVLARAADEADGWQLTFSAGNAEQVLGFRIEEVREARLVPVLDFKGRKSEGSAAPAAAEGGDVAGAAPVSGSAPGVEGG